MKLTPFHPDDDVNIGVAIDLLRQARHLLTRSGARRAADRVRAALRSAQGAARHVQRRRWQTGYPQ